MSWQAFQHAGHLLEHGIVDTLAPRGAPRKTLIRIPGVLRPLKADMAA